MTLAASTSSLPHTLGRTNRSPNRHRTLREEDATVFGYESPPDTPTLNREVFKWIQSLDLSHALKNVRRDTANGFLVAEVFSRYFPSDIQMHGFANAVSSKYKVDNWGQLQRFSSLQALDLPVDLVEGTMQGVHGAAVALLEHLYELFTGKKVQRMSELPLNLSGAGGAGGLTGVGGTESKDSFKPISTQLKAATTVEFGQVQTQVISDVADLRKRLASGK